MLRLSGLTHQSDVDNLVQADTRKEDRMPKITEVPSRQTVNDRIVATTMEILRDRGPLAVTVEAVAAASGVAKTTIYRRYEDRDALVRAAIDAATTEVDLPTELTMYDTFHLLLSESTERIQEIIGRGTAAAILLDDDAQFRTELHHMIRARTRHLVALIDKRAAAGELRSGLDAKLVVSVLFGAAMGQVIRGGAPDADWADRVLTLMWPSLTGKELSR
jgi:AcrR family transcriptional regulator